MNKTLIDFTKGIKSINITKYRCRDQKINENDRCARITIDLDIKENYTLYNALRYDYENNDG